MEGRRRRDLELRLSLLSLELLEFELLLVKSSTKSFFSNEGFGLLLLVVALDELQEPLGRVGGVDWNEGRVLDGRKLLSLGLSRILMILVGHGVERDEEG